MSISGEILWRLFVKAHELAVHPDIAYNENVQHEAMDLAVWLSELVKEFELRMKNEGRQLPYNNSIFANSEYEWYIQHSE